MSKREGLVTAAWVTAPAELRALCDAAEGEHEGAESGDGHQHEAACRRCQARSRIAGLGFMPNDTGVARARAYADLQERVEADGLCDRCGSDAWEPCSTDECEVSLIADHPHIYCRLQGELAIWKRVGEQWFGPEGCDVAIVDKGIQDLLAEVRMGLAKQGELALLNTGEKAIGGEG